MGIRSVSTLKEWTGYRCYVTYLALKLHFSSKTYDFFKYGGKTAASVSSFETRRDRYQFEKLARHPDPLGVMLSHLCKDPKAWIGSISPNSDTYTEFVKRHDAFAYHVGSDLSKLKETLDENLFVPEGSHPYLLSALLAGEVSLETVCVLQRTFNFIPYWDEAILDPVVWPENRMKIVKMLPFLDYDDAKVKKVIDDKIEV